MKDNIMIKIDALEAESKMLSIKNNVIKASIKNLKKFFFINELYKIKEKIIP